MKGGFAVSNVRTYRKERWAYFALSVAFYFLPFTITAACLLPLVKAVTGFKLALGFGIVVVNAVPFLVGVFRWFFSHFPMLNFVSLLFLALEAFFRMDVFRTYADIFLWIELAAGVGSILSCIFWAKYLKYSSYNKTMQATLKSGAFVMKEDK